MGVVPDTRTGPTLDGDISLHKLEVLCLVVELGTITQAAQQLYVAQPVVSAHIRSLETRLNVKLFQRQGRTLKLTEAGERVHDWALSTLGRTEAMLGEVDRFRNGELGAVRLGTTLSLGTYRLPILLASYLQRHPQIYLDVYTSDSETAIADVERGALDFCVVLLSEPPGEALLRYEEIGSEELAFVTSPDGEPKGDRISASDLRAVSFVGAPPSTASNSLHNLVAGYGIDYGTRLALSHPEAIKRAVLEGCGAAVLFRCAVENEIGAGVLREITLEGANVTVPIYLVRRHDSRLSPLQQDLIATIHDHFGQQP